MRILVVEDDAKMAELLRRALKKAIASQSRRTGALAWQNPSRGISIARWIVTRHQGAIEVHSNPGKGGTFTVRLPLAAVPNTAS
jgi:light-regulated signal transduction histidine kinase (bacteriophytochrome)